LEYQHEKPLEMNNKQLCMSTRKACVSHTNSFFLSKPHNTIILVAFASHATQHCDICNIGRLEPTMTRTSLRKETLRQRSAVVTNAPTTKKKKGGELRKGHLVVKVCFSKPLLKSSPQPPAHIQQMMNPNQQEKIVDHTTERRNILVKFYKLIDHHIEGHVELKKVDKKVALQCLSICRSRKGPRNNRQSALEYLKQMFKKEWAAATTDLRQGNGPQEKSRRMEPLLIGRREELAANLTQVDPDLPIEMAVMVKACPLHIMLGLMQQYGSAYFVSEFNQHAESIVTSRRDEQLIDSFTKRADAATDAETDDLEIKKANEEAMQNERLFLLGLQEEEEAGKDPEVAGKDPEIVGTKLYEDAITSELWKSTKSLEDYRRKSLKKKQRDTAIVKECLRLMDSLNIDPWWFRQPRSRYFLHHWRVGPRNLRGSAVECSDIAATGSSPFDCPTLAIGGGAASVSSLDYYVRDILEILLSKEATSSDRRKDTSTSFFKRKKAELQFFPGIIKSGDRGVHQDLHVDNPNIIKTRLMSKILGNKTDSLSSKDWLAGGYVIDMPLSREGAWLRIAVPDSKKKTFRIKWMYIPFGSFVIRSMTLFHSGHYGSPGNTRFHALAFPLGTTTASKNLGYLRSLCHKGGKGDGWKYIWDADVAFKHQGADGYVDYTNPQIRQQKALGTKYFKRVMENYNETLPTTLWLLNPLPVNAKDSD
jgi:hypothetical protein